MAKMAKRPNFKIVKATSTNKWLPPLWRKSTFPVLRQPAKSLKDITGTAFLLSYNKQDFIVTASHVIEMKNPVLMFSKKNNQSTDKESVLVSSDDLHQIGLDWTKHPAGLDLAAIPFCTESLQRDLDVFLLAEDKWTFRPFSVNDEIVHLGYPDKGTSNCDGSPWVFPQGMPGNIIHVNSFDFNMKTSGVHGASGGPVFLKTKENKPHLIGVVTETELLGYITKALCISLVKDILDTDAMKGQLMKLEKFR